MVHTGVAWPYSACRSGSGLNEGLGRTVAGAMEELVPNETKRGNSPQALTGLEDQPGSSLCGEVARTAPVLIE